MCEEAKPSGGAARATVVLAVLRNLPSIIANNRHMKNRINSLFHLCPILSIVFLILYCLSVLMIIMNFVSGS
jgi:hypothetical protein